MAHEEYWANRKRTPRILIENGPLEDLAPLAPTRSKTRTKSKVHVTKIKVSKRQQARKRTTATDRRSHANSLNMRRGQGTRATAVTESVRRTSWQIVIKRPMGAAIFKLGRSGTLGRGTQVRHVEPENETLTLGAQQKPPAAGRKRLNTDRVENQPEARRECAKAAMKVTDRRGGQRQQKAPTEGSERRRRVQHPH
jgi:hypothetical protein